MKLEYILGIFVFLFVENNTQHSPSTGVYAINIQNERSLLRGNIPKSVGEPQPPSGTAIVGQFEHKEDEEEQYYQRYLQLQGDTSESPTESATEDVGNISTEAPTTGFPTGVEAVTTSPTESATRDDPLVEENIPTATPTESVTEDDPLVGNIPTEAPTTGFPTGVKAVTANPTESATEDDPLVVENSPTANPTEGVTDDDPLVGNDPTETPTTSFPTESATEDDPLQVGSESPTESATDDGSLVGNSPTDVPTTSFPTVVDDGTGEPTSITTDFVVETEGPTDMPTRRPILESVITIDPVESPTEPPTAPVESPTEPPPTTTEPSPAPSPKPTPNPLPLHVDNLQQAAAGIQRGGKNTLLSF